jgi:hypothetical protein
MNNASPQGSPERSSSPIPQTGNSRSIAYSKWGRP